MTPRLSARRADARRGKSRSVRALESRYMQHRGEAAPVSEPSWFRLLLQRGIDRRIVEQLRQIENENANAFDDDDFVFGITRQVVMPSIRWRSGDTPSRVGMIRDTRGGSSVADEEAASD